MSDTPDELWNYIVVVDAGAEVSQAFIYRYNDNVEQGEVVKLETQNEWSQQIAPGLATFLDGNNESSFDLEKDHLKPIEEFAKSVIPADQIRRTPLFLHSTATLRAEQKKPRHKLMQKICSYFKDKTELILEDCKNQIYEIVPEMEASLGWLTVNTLKGTLKESETFLELAPGNVQAVFEPKEESKSKAYRIRLNGGSSDAATYDVLPKVYEGLGVLTLRQKYISDLKGTEDPCMPKGLELDGHSGTGNYEECSKAVHQYVKKIDDLNLDQDTKYGNKVVATNLFSKYILPVEGDLEKLKAYCESNWSDIERDRLTDANEVLTVADFQQLCFGATVAFDVLQDGFSLNVSETELVREINDVPYSWTYGRALVYACDEKHPGGGIQPNSASNIWYLGTTSSMARPALGDVASRLDSGSHRLYGGLVFLGGLLLVVYLLLGKTRRHQISQGLWKRFGGREKYVGVRHDDFELDELDDEYEV